MTRFQNIPLNVIEKIGKLAFGHDDWITSDINISYYPYIKEHYEDADEFWMISFTGYFAGNHKADYIVRIYPNLNVCIWYTYKDEKNQVLHLSNQNEIQNILNEYK